MIKAQFGLTPCLVDNARNLRQEEYRFICGSSLNTEALDIYLTVVKVIL